MIIPEFKYHQPSTIKEFLEIKNDLKEKSFILAGGTDLIVNMKKGIIAPENIISLKGIKEPSLNSVRFENGVIQIGACVTADQLSVSKQLKGALDAIASGGASLGTPLIRNRATVGGNIINARPAADLIPPLIACDASLVLRSKSRKREVSLDGFLTGPGMTELRNNELLVGIKISKPGPGSGSAYIKLGTRRALEISLVNVAAYIEIDSSGGAVSDVRIVMGAVGPTPLRAEKAEQSLMGQKPAASNFKKAGIIASGECSPIDDFRGSAEYRREMVRVLTIRALKKALQEARKNK
jgi:CO/xanthine dehydrogenase FAD-binding subunit